MRMWAPVQGGTAWRVLDGMQKQEYHRCHCVVRQPPGTGVHVYVLDTGIRSTHDEFQYAAADGSRADPPPGAAKTRVSQGFDAVYDSNNAEDCHGHGTHVRDGNSAGCC